MTGVKMRGCKGLMVIVSFVALHASAAELRVRVIDSHGAPVDDAVITVKPQGELNGEHRSASVTKIIDQKNETFVPYMEIFRPGDKVVFHNSDRTRHHVYTFAPARQFEFVLTPGQSSDAIELDHVGSIAVGCNIHDRMITYLYVSDAPWVGRTDKSGSVTLTDLPAGKFEVRAWHPQLRPGKPDNVQIVEFASASDGKAPSFSLALLPDPRTPADRERSVY
jgi:plastocyanin